MKPGGANVVVGLHSLQTVFPSTFEQPKTGRLPSSGLDRPPLVVTSAEPHQSDRATNFTSSTP
jgi:hypothetical protein